MTQRLFLSTTSPTQFCSWRLIKEIGVIKTTIHWRGKSKIEDIKSGLKALIAEVQQLGISSIAIPPLGCGNGGLDWVEVKPLIESTFAELPEVKVVIFDPAGAPEVDKMQVATPKPKFTSAHAFMNKTG